MRDYSREMISNTIFRDEFFSNLDNAISDFRSREDYESIVHFKTIKKRVQEYIEAVEK